MFCVIPGTHVPNNLNYVADMVQKQRTTPISEFEISHDSNTNTWHVVGSGLHRFVQMTNWRSKILPNEDIFCPLGSFYNISWIVL